MGIAASKPPPSASRLVRDPRFKKYLDGAKIVGNATKSQKVKNTYSELSNFTLPKAFYDDIKKPQKAILQGESEFLTPIKAWAKKNAAVGLSSSDQLQIRDTWRILSLFHHKVLVVSQDKTASEAKQRKAVDFLIRLAFSEHAGVKFNTSLEKDLRIRKSGAAHPVTHKADLFVGTQVRHGVFGDPPPQPSEDLDKDPRSNAVLGSPATDELELMVFAVEFKKKRGANNQNQLIYSLSSGQSQRKALGLVNKPLFGAVCADGIFKLYASWWNQKAEICFAECSSGDLRDPIQFLMAYTFFCNLRADSVRIQEELDSLDLEGGVTKILDRLEWRS